MRADIRRLMQGTMVYGLGEVVNRVIGFLLLPLFTSYLTPKDYGISAILGLVTFLAIPVFSLGFGTALGAVYFESSERVRRDAVVWTAFLLLLVSSAVMIGTGWLLDGWISVTAFGEPGYEYLIKLSLAGAAATILATPLRLRLQFEEQAKRYVVFSALSTAISLGSTILMVVVLRRGIAGFVEGGVIGQTVTLLLFGSGVLPSLRWSFRAASGSALMRIGIATIPGFAFLFILQQGNRYLLRWFDGLDAVGIYTIGYNLGFAMNVLVSAFTSAWTPYFLSFTEKKEEARPLFGSVFSYYVLGFGLVSLFFYIAARPVVMLMTQPAFHASYRVVGLCATAQYLIGIFSMVLAPVYFAKEVPKVTIVQGFAAAAALAVTAVLVRFGGAFGAGVSLPVGFFLMTLFLLIWNYRHRGTYFRPAYDWARTLRFALFYAVIAVLFLVPRTWSLAVEGAVALIAMAVVTIIFMSVFVKPHERSAAVGFLRTKLGV